MSLRYRIAALIAMVSYVAVGAAAFYGQLGKVWRSLKRRWYQREILMAYESGEVAIGVRLDKLAYRWVGPRADGEPDAKYRKRLLDHLTMRWLHS